MYAMKKTDHESFVPEIQRFPPMPFGEGRPVQPRFDYEDRVQRVNVDAALLADELRREIAG